MNHMETKRNLDILIATHMMLIAKDTLEQDR